MHVPTIDFKAYDPQAPGTIGRISASVDTALAEIGFMSAVNLPISDKLLADVFSASRDFFGSDSSVKSASAYRTASENFGYQGLCEENLDPNSPADLKETFTMRNVLNKPPDDSRWPSAGFRDLMCEFYAAGLNAAFQLQRVLANALGVDPEFFVDSPMTNGPGERPLDCFSGPSHLISIHRTRTADRENA